MPRTRDLKPGFFTNAGIAELNPLTRLFFQGLWIHADREGRLEYKPKALKVQILPYDNVEIGELIDELLNARDESGHNFIKLYEVDGSKYIEICNFTNHQNIHPKEVDSKLPSPLIKNETGKEIKDENLEIKHENLDIHASELAAIKKDQLPLPSFPSFPSIPSNTLSLLKKESESVFSDVQSSEQKPIRENPDLFIEHGEAMREFWEAYPKSTKRRLMESAFLQAVVSGKATPEQLVSRAKAVRAKMTKDEQSFSFAPDPHRWLENEQWADGTLDAFEHSEKVEATTLKLHYQRVLASPTVYDPSNGNRYDTAGAEHFQRFKNGDDLIRFPDGFEIYASHLQPA